MTPALVDLQIGYLALGLERHDDFHQFVDSRIIDELNVLPHHLFGNFLWKH